MPDTWSVCLPDSTQVENLLEQQDFDNAKGLIGTDSEMVRCFPIIVCYRNSINNNKMAERAIHKL